MSDQNNVLYQDLPEEFLPEPSSSDRTKFLLQVLGKDMQNNDNNRMTREMSTAFTLGKHLLTVNNPKKALFRKKTFITRKERKDLKILKLTKKGWDYASLEPMRSMWKSYMEENLGLLHKKPPTCTEPDYAGFSLVLMKSELSGAEITVVRSKVPTQVGITGTIVLETKQTFQVVTRDSKLKTLPKQLSMFEFRLGSMKITVFGKHLLVKPSERSVKKIKTQMLPDL